MSSLRCDYKIFYYDQVEQLLLRVALQSLLQSESISIKEQIRVHHSRNFAGSSNDKILAVSTNKESDHCGLQNNIICFSKAIAKLLYFTVKAGQAIPINSRMDYSINERNQFAINEFIRQVR